MRYAIKKRCLLYGGLVVFLYGALMALVYIMQPRLIFAPDREMGATPQDAGLEYEDLILTTKDGVRINAWFVPAKQGAVTLLFFHGNGGNISHRLLTIKMLNSLGANVLIPDYRGYGKSDGEPTEEGVYLDADAAWDHLTKTMKIPPNKIIIFGRSFGGAVAAWLSARVRPKGTILESTFTSVPDMGREMYPFLPVKLLSRFFFNTKRQVAKMTGPVLVIHSPDDEIIPFSHGQILFDAAPDPKRFLKIHGDHNNGFFETGEPYINALQDFLSGRP